MSYKHKVQYYETDKMGITHHSNYLRFMEEARVDYLDKIGYGYQRMENEGLVSPVVAVNIEYKHPTTFNDEIEVEVRLLEVTAVKLTIGYTMICRSQTVCTATSLHCFVDEHGKPISIKRMRPELFELLAAHVQCVR